MEEGCKNVEEVVSSFADVGIKDRSMVWNSDLIEVDMHPHLFMAPSGLVFQASGNALSSPSLIIVFSVVRIYMGNFMKVINA